ncbi:MAG TPA: RNA polymerase sigma factor [Kofleriaceae bacterium]|nr:RNA polymerase sigma factor [Kofleriaceae bacterium]
MSFGPEDRGLVYAVARRIVRTPQDAEDVTQEALLLAYQHRASYRGDARYRTWLHRIAATTALGHLRKRRRSREVLASGPGTVGVDVPDRAASPEAALAGAQQRACVQAALSSLEPHFREVLLCRAEGSDAEAAARLGLTVTNVKVRAHRARQRLRPLLEGVR